MHSAIKLATSKGLFKKLKLGTLGGIAIGGVMGQLVMPKLLAKASAKHKLEGSNNVTLATGFQKQVAKPVQTQELSGAAPALPQSQDALSRRNLSLLQRKSLDSTEYEDPKDDLVSFERGLEKQRTKGNQGTKSFWTRLMDKAKQDFDRDLLAKERKKTSPKARKK